MNTIRYENACITPSKVVCIGRNYVEHIEELGNELPDSMVVFNKPNSAITPDLHFIGEDTRFEGEICFLIRNKKIEGIGFGLDLTKAEIQNYLKSKGLPWERAKGFDRSAVLSDFIRLDHPLETLRMELRQNGILVQFADYDLMIYKPGNMVKEILGFMSLDDGDIIMSGTPKGVGNYLPGDEFIGRIYSCGELLLEKRWIAKA